MVDWGSNIRSAGLLAEQVQTYLTHVYAGYCLDAIHGVSPENQWDG